jgi:hypothetical protein
MEKKMHSYCEMLAEIAQTRNLPEEIRGLIGTIQNAHVARSLLDLDEEQSILDANTDFCMRATLGVRELVKLGLIGRTPEGGMETSGFLEAAATIHALFDAIRVLAERHNMNGDHVISHLVNNPKVIEAISSVRRFIVPSMP